MLLLQFIILQVIVFTAVIYFLKKILYSDTQSAVNRLDHVYQDLLAKQKELQQKIEQAEKEYQDKKTETSQVSEKMKAQLLDEMREKEDHIVKGAKGQADELIAKARASSDKFYREIEQKVTSKHIDLMADLLGHAFSPQMMAAIHHEMVKDFLSRGKDFDLTNLDSKADHLVVKTALALSKEENGEIAALLAKKLNRAVRLQEEVDNHLIAGVVIQAGTLLLDGSLASHLSEAALQAKKNVEAGG
jgi:F0F1-type ATP synthase membrane subunit b/b'